MSNFSKDVLAGLTAGNKKLSSKYFYDDAGSRIFQQIMGMDSYYLTDSEFEILREQSAQIVDQLSFEGHFEIVELGAGDGKKTFHLLDYLVQHNYDFTYRPVDISAEANQQLEKQLSEKLPQLKLSSITGDYFEVLKNDIAQSNRPVLLLFLGSNIGNYNQEDGCELLKMFSASIKPNDCLLMGMDVRKNPRTILKAYDDDEGITRSFNLNLLRRINRELKANFDLEAFDFYCHYNPTNGEVRSYLISLADQQVNIEEIGKVIHFKQYELIATELSKKYDVAEISEMANTAGFSVRHNFTDTKGYFIDSLWRKQ